MSLKYFISNISKGVAMAGIALMALAAMTLAPSTAYAADGDIISIISTAGDNVYNILITLYYVAVVLVGGLFLVSTGKEILPAIWKSDVRNGQEFSRHLYNFGTAIVVVIIFLTLPVWAPALFDYFGATGFDFSGLSS